MNAPVDVLNTLRKFERTYMVTGLTEEAGDIASVFAAVSELIERLNASSWRLENLLAMMPADRPERADIERDLADNRAILARVGGAA